jgi:hypothetical protein
MSQCSGASCDEDYGVSFSGGGERVGASLGNLTLSLARVRFAFTTRHREVIILLLSSSQAGRSFFSFRGTFPGSNFMLLFGETLDVNPIITFFN